MITGVILARNEERHIVDCLQSLRSYVAEILLIDMESEDRTVELARPFVTRVLTHPLIPNFDSARNIAIPESAHDWLWFVDADERISERTGRLVVELVEKQGSEFEAITIPFKSYFCGQWMQHCGWWPGYTMPRVLKRGHFQFAEKLHGGVEVSGRQIRIAPDPEIAVDHFSYNSIEHYLEKLNRYTSTEAKQLAEENRRFDWREAMRHMMHDLWVYYEANPGKLDRERGWILSWLSGQYRWISHAKLIDSVAGSSPSENGDSVPADLGEVVGLMEDELAILRTGQAVAPLGIVWRSPIWDPSGYADEGRTLAKALSSGERPVVLEEITWSDKTCEIPAGDRALLRAMARGRRALHTVTITDCISTLVEPDRKSALNILRTTFETDRIPDQWHASINKFDEVWVISRHNEAAFRRSGTAPEQIRVVPSCIDTDRFGPDGDKIALPDSTKDRFVFLSIFDWQLRKGWDVLLRAYCAEFQPSDKMSLLLKITRASGYPLEVVHKQANRVLEELGKSLEKRSDVVIWDETLEGEQVAALYRSVDAFVLPSRGEGWGRPYMEAMASGLPVIGTQAGGNIDFMNAENSFLIPATLVDVPEEAAREIPPYAGHRWFEPEQAALQQLMREVTTDERKRSMLAAVALRDIREQFDLDSGRQAFERALAAAEERFVQWQSPEVDAEKIRVAWEGELFAGHSFANINENLALELIDDDKLALSLQRVEFNPALDDEVPHAHRLKPYIHRALPNGPHVTVRHAFPPNWNPPSSGLWVHIQPWEFGHLPMEWVTPLRDQVTEIWAPSNYVKRVYARSGIPGEKIRVIPWGVDPEVFASDVVPLLLPTSKSFAFLFVGGTIPRKGFDVLLEAYLSEFGPEDDVCLVVKDLGTSTFYRHGNLRERALAARDDPTLPEIVYLDANLTHGQLASLYRACDCLVAPYRGEGFGLPILEAMACGVAPIVPRGGASDDFVSEQTAYVIPATEVEGEFETPLAGPALVLSVQVDDVRAAMRRAFEQRAETQKLGEAAAQHVRKNYSWAKTATVMRERLLELGSKQREAEQLRTEAPRFGAQSLSNGLLAVCLLTQNDEQVLGNCLSRIAPFVHQIIVTDLSSSDRTVAIAGEYGAEVIETSAKRASARLRQKCAERATANWILWIEAGDVLGERDVEGMHELLSGQPESVSEISMVLSKSRLTARHGRKTDRLQFTRRI